MEYINVNGKKFKFIRATGENEKHRASFNELTEKTFGFNFEQWYRSGYWTKQFMPYSIMDGDKVISNVSVNTMVLEAFGKKKQYIQLGTVMSDTAYRNQGLIRVIMQRILEEWKDKSELIYLFANDSVLDFYPKFGFAKLKQYQCSKLINKSGKLGTVKKLNMDNEADRRLVYDKAMASVSLSMISMCGNAELIMFYCTLFMQDNVYYLQDYDAVVIANFTEDTLELLGILCEEEVSIDKVIDCLANEAVKRVKLYFTPKETKSYAFTSLEGEDTLFVLGRDKELFENSKFMFPKLSHT